MLLFEIILLGGSFLCQSNDVLKHSEEVGRVIPKVLTVLVESGKCVLVVMLIPKDTFDNIEIEMYGDSKFLLCLLASGQLMVN